MTWDEDSVLQAASTVGFGGSIWILHLAENSHVGKGPTSDYHTERNQVRSYVQSEGLDDPGIPTIKRGFKNISRKRVVDVEGRSGVINNEKKPNLVCLTRLGITLMTTLNTNDQISNAFKENIGLEEEGLPDPWWPGDGPRENFTVYLYTHADHSVRNETEIEIDAYARFECTCCGDEVENEFELTLEDGIIVNEWGRMVTAECDTCENTFEHSVADPHREPNPL